MLIDMHAHSADISLCCKATLEDVLTYTKENGMDGVVLANHYTSKYLKNETPADFARRFVAEYRRAKALGERMDCRVFFGIEVTMERHTLEHMLVYGVDEAFPLQHPTMYSYTQAELYRAVKACGGRMVQAHPLRRGKNSLLDLSLMDGIETNSHPLYDSTHFEELAEIARENGLLMTAGGDFHKDTHRPKCGVYLPDHLQSTRDIMEYLAATPRIELCVQEPQDMQSRNVTFIKKEIAP